MELWLHLNQTPYTKMTIGVVLQVPTEEFEAEGIVRRLECALSAVDGLQLLTLIHKQEQV